MEKDRDRNSSHVCVRQHLAFLGKFFDLLQLNSMSFDVSSMDPNNTSDFVELTQRSLNTTTLCALDLY